MGIFKEEKKPKSRQKVRESHSQEEGQGITMSPQLYKAVRLSGLKSQRVPSTAN